MNANLDEMMRLQSAEFAAVAELAVAFHNLPAVVDDDFPRMRHQYERVVYKTMNALVANGRLQKTQIVVDDFSIMQPWTAKLGLRHQGVLVSAIRGCDSVEREDASKHLVRMYRGILLRAHCGDIKKAATFMVPFDQEIWDHTSADFLRSIDHYPNHWLLHWMHACEIVGYKHDMEDIRQSFNHMYIKLVRKFHLLPESEQLLDERLTADEKTFRNAQEL